MLHVYSCLFGDFLCNMEKERISERVYQQTLSVWKMLCLPGSPFVNLLYRPPSEKDRVIMLRLSDVENGDVLNVVLSLNCVDDSKDLKAAKFLIL